MIESAAIYQAFADFSFGKESGLGTWLMEGYISPLVLDRLRQLDTSPVSKVQLNQLLVISGIASVSDGFFRYYWLECPSHTYDVASITPEPHPWLDSKEDSIRSLAQFRWGLYRMYLDAMLYFGSIKAGFEMLRSMSHKQIHDFFAQKCFDTGAVAARGPGLPLRHINKDDRYLISEMACKSYGPLPDDSTTLRNALVEAWRAHTLRGGGAARIRDLLSEIISRGATPEPQVQMQLAFAADDIMDRSVTSEAEVLAQYETVARKFAAAREAALHNTALYLSVVNDLDVYVATSMRTREDFRRMATACEQIFGDKRLEDLHLRYFDPTMSAADGHEDKGLIECLMVKCAKVLVYCAGAKESYGKDAEAAMALSLGKPVIFYCDAGQRAGFYKDVHPLSRLIDFRSGVAVGALVTDSIHDVVELLSRNFRNQMQYRLDRHPQRQGFIRLTEVLTTSAVRVQTDDVLLTRTFWNNYHNREPRKFVSLAAGKEAERLQE